MPLPNLKGITFEVDCTFTKHQPSDHQPGRMHCHPLGQTTPVWSVRSTAPCYRHRHSTSNLKAKAASTTAASGGTLNVVITGGSKGLGFAMAHEFLQAGDNVLLCGRNPARLQAALQHLQQHSAVRPSQVHGVECDVSNAADVQHLADFVAKRLGRVDRWINNAGQVTRKQLLPLLEPQELQAVVGVNVLGSLLCCRAAVQLMQQYHEQQQQQQQPSQPQRGPQAQAQYHIFNCGFSQWGASFSKSACTHKATKMALTQLSKSLAEELSEAGLGYIGVHNLSPGMVLTDLLLQGASPVARRFFNVLAEEPETVAAVLVPQIRVVQGTGSSIDYLSPAAAVARVVTGVPQIINGGRFFDKDGYRVDKTAACACNSAGVRLLYNFPADQY